MSENKQRITGNPRKGEPPRYLRMFSPRIYQVSDEADALPPPVNVAAHPGRQREQLLRLVRGAPVPPLCPDSFGGRGLQGVLWANGAIGEEGKPEDDDARSQRSQRFQRYYREETGGHRM